MLLTLLLLVRLTTLHTGVVSLPYDPIPGACRAGSDGCVVPSNS